MDIDTLALRRFIVGGAALIGACGIVAAATASHAGESRNLTAIAAICLAHGPALLALGLGGRGSVLALASVLLTLGTAVFAGDLAVREWLGHGLFPGAAPLGGAAMIGGWLAIGIGGLGMGGRDQA